MSFINASGRSSFTRRAVTASENATSIPALAMLRQCGLLPQPEPHSKLFDNACGAGIVTKQFLQHCKPSSADDDISIVCGDLDLTMVDLTHDLVREQGWADKVQIQKIDSHHTGWPDSAFTHVLMNFGPQLMKDPIQMLRETLRLLTPNGVMGFTAWVKPGFIPSIRATFPDFNPTKTPVLSEWRDVEEIKSTLTNLGYVDVKVAKLDFETNEEDVEAYLELMGILMKPLLGMGDNGEKYAQHMRGLKEKGETKMEWTALIVSALKDAS